MTPRSSLGHRAISVLLDLVAAKPISVFVWWFSNRANSIAFPDRALLLARTERALAAGRPVLFASNHVSWFDDPVIPMALFRTGHRAVLECLGVAAVAIASWWLLPASAGMLLVASAAAAIALFGTRKVWWTLGDLVNLSDATVLRGKVALVKQSPPGRLRRWFLSFCDRLIPSFMRSGTVRTVFVDRRPGEEARQTRARAVETTIDIAARPEPVWVFFEGGRTKVPGRIAPARRGIGALALGLHARGLDPLLIVVYHEGMERLIPPGAARFLSYGHQVEVRWAEFDLDAAEAAGHKSPEEVALAVRQQVVELQAALHAERGDGG